MNYNPKPICEESKHCPKPTWGNLKEKVTPPNDYQSTGRPSGMMRMTWKETRRKDKKRSTPKDVENEKKGIYRGSKPRKRARKPTVEENRANKMTSVITSAELISIRPWSLFISDELRNTLLTAKTAAGRAFRGFGTVWDAESMMPILPFHIHCA